MTVGLSTSVLALSVAGWKSVGGQLLASGVLLLSGHQDIGLRARMGAAFGFFMAIAFGISALITAIRASLWYAAAINWRRSFASCSNYSIWTLGLLSKLSVNKSTALKRATSTFEYTKSSERPS